MRVLLGPSRRAWRNATERASPLPCPYGLSFVPLVWRLATYRLRRDDRARRRVHDDRADVRADTLVVDIVERHGPDGLRRDALLEEPHLRLLRVRVPVFARDLDRLLARDVAPGRPASARDHAREDESHEQYHAAEPPAVAEVPKRRGARARRVAVSGRGRRHGGRGSRRSGS